MALRATRAALPSKCPCSLPLDCRRYISAYGYTQAKSLVYSQHGEPKDVLE
jgi:trans-2-enoyl-CoA reductase